MNESMLSVESRSAGGFKSSADVKPIFLAQKVVRKLRTSLSDILLN